MCFGCCRWYPSVFTGEVGSSCQLSCCVLGGLLVLSIRVGGTPGVLWVLTKVLCVVSGGGGVPAALVFAWSCVSLLSCMLFLGSWCCFLGRRVELMAMDVRGPLDSCVVRCDSVDSFPFGASGLRGCGVSASILSLRLPWGEVESFIVSCSAHCFWCAFIFFIVPLNCLHSLQVKLMVLLWLFFRCLFKSLWFLYLLGGIV